MKFLPQISEWFCIFWKFWSIKFKIFLNDSFSLVHWNLPHVRIPPKPLCYIVRWPKSTFWSTAHVRWWSLVWNGSNCDCTFKWNITNVEFFFCICWVKYSIATDWLPSPRITGILPWYPIVSMSDNVWGIISLNWFATCSRAPPGSGEGKLLPISLWSISEFGSIKPSNGSIQNWFILQTGLSVSLIVSISSPDSFPVTSFSKARIALLTPGATCS